MWQAQVANENKEIMIHRGRVMIGCFSYVRNQEFAISSHWWKGRAVVFLFSTRQYLKIPTQQNNTF